MNHELELVKYILKNAQVLKTMGIHIGLLDLEEECIRWKLSKFPKGSLTCQLEFLTVCILSLMNIIMIEWLPILIITYFK